jgi:hypothetical protein
MATYEVSVRVDFNYEVEANSQEEAEEQGWHWEDYCHHSDVYSINVEEIESDEEEDND